LTVTAAADTSGGNGALDELTLLGLAALGVARIVRAKANLIAR
jgi:hypothetical protein